MPANDDDAEEPLAIVRGVMLCLAGCPRCRGSPQICCASCGPDLQILGLAAFRILGANPASDVAPRDVCDVTQ
jgi:hypothetical protein